MKKESKVVLFKRQHDGTQVKIESPGSDQDISEMLQLFTDFLKGCGYYIDGELEFIQHSHTKE